MVTFSLLIFSPNIEASSREVDLKAILDQQILSPLAMPYLHSVIDSLILESEITIDKEILIAKFREVLFEEAILIKFAEPYKIFSDEELHELRFIVESPVLAKYSQHGMEISLSGIQIIKETLKEMIETYKYH